MAGRPPKPTKLKVLQGNPGRRPLPKGEPEPPLGAKCPAWLTLNQRKLWREYAPIFEPLGLLTQADVPAFANWMVLLDQVQQIVKAGNPVPPYLMAEARAHAVQFGATPSGRARVSVEPKKPESKLARLMKSDR